MSAHATVHIASKVVITDQYIQSYDIYTLQSDFIEHMHLIKYTTIRQFRLPPQEAGRSDNAFILSNFLQYLPTINPLKHFNTTAVRTTSH
jgi:hypothetical protein